MNKYKGVALFLSGVLAGIVWQLASGIISRPLAAALVLPMAGAMAYTGWACRAETGQAREQANYQRGRRDGIHQAIKTFDGEGVPHDKG